MPSVYLSPSTREFDLSAYGGNEEYYMNLIADAMIPYLRASGISFDRNQPGFNIRDIVNQSNSIPHDLHLSLHTKSTPENYTEPLQGIEVYYYAFTHLGGDIAAQIFADNLKTIYPNPDLVTVIPNTTSIELVRTNAPAVLLELGYHDNYQDSKWVHDNVNEIGRNLALSVAEFLNVPFVDPYV